MHQKKRKLVIHAGMHKTGSTAIQHWLKNTSLSDVHYFDWNRANQGQLFVLMFQENPHEHHSIARLGMTAEQARKMGQDQRRLVREQVENSPKQTFVFSAERISSAPDAAIEDMHAFFSEMFDDIEVYAYIRGPARFMASMFQQHLKTHGVKFTTNALWPRYKKRIGRLIDIFGKDRVHLRAFSSLTEKKADVVADFAEWSGIAPKPAQQVQRNTSMSAEAVSLLYFYRTHVEPEMKAKQKKRANAYLRKTIVKMPGEPFDLQICSSDELDPAKKKDLHWMSKKLGVDLDDFASIRTDRRVFRTEQDLIAHAIGSSHLLSTLKGAAPLDPSAPDSMEQTAARLKKHFSHM